MRGGMRAGGGSLHGAHGTRTSVKRNGTSAAMRLSSTSWYVGRAALPLLRGIHESVSGLRYETVQPYG